MFVKNNGLDLIIRYILGHVVYENNYASTNQIELVLDAMPGIYTSIPHVDPKVDIQEFVILIDGCQVQFMRKFTMCCF